jgi:hypothetical protein
MIEGLFRHLPLFHKKAACASRGVIGASKVTPTEPKLALEPTAPGPKPAQPANPEPAEKWQNPLCDVRPTIYLRSLPIIRLGRK